MALIGTASSPAQGKEIARLLTEVLGIDAEPEELQRWKYWDDHPLFREARSYILLSGGALAAHGCSWPVRLRGSFGELSCMHWTDWAARSDAPGAGIAALSRRKRDFAAVFSIGGSTFTKKILPAIGFRPYNAVSLLYRPFRPFRAALRSYPRDWKFPLRAVRNFARSRLGTLEMPPGWSFSQVSPGEIPEALFPRALSDEAVSQRNPELLAYMMRCPAFKGAACYLLHYKGAPTAYFLIASCKGQARVLDYGPNGMTEGTASALAVAAQLAARSEFPETVDILTATTESAVLAGFIRAGFCRGSEDRIQAVKLNEALQDTTTFRFTLLDWDAAIL